MSESITTIALRDEQDTIYWLREATRSDPARPILDCLSKQGNFVVTTDGFCAHFAKTPRCMEELPGTTPHKQANYRVSEPAITWEQETDEFPDIKSIFSTGELQVRFRISPHFLVRALEGFLHNNNTGVFISVYDDHRVVIQSPEVDRYAVVMGMHKRASDLEGLWEPEGSWKEE